MSIFGLFTEGMAGFALVYMLTAYLAVIACGVIAYLFRSIGYYTIAKRRGIYNPWLAWVPAGDAWILGCISDQYRYVTKGKVCKRRKKLLGLSIAIFATIIPVIAGVVMIVLGEHTSAVTAGIGVGLLVLAYAVMVILSIILTVHAYIALYDLYASCQPKRAVLYLLLSIIVSVPLPFFVFGCRNKDLGMIPQAPAQPAEPDQT